MGFFHSGRSRPGESLTGIFAAWKSLLLAIAVGSGIGQPYDTSTTLVTGSNHIASSEAPWDIGAKLTRWDAIYFVQSARRGYVFEQERAFASGLPWLTTRITNSLHEYGIGTDTTCLESLVGIAISHFSHLLSVLVLYQLSLAITKNNNISYVAALLHIFSPAGLFLSAPYSEATFSLLSFLGYFLLAKGLLGRDKSGQRKLAHDAGIISAGIWFGFSCLFRSNGLFNGIPFAAMLLIEMTSVPPSLESIRRRFALIVGGSAIATGFLAPQISAYLTFCVRPIGEQLRPWCSNTPPSIYTFVQSRYWNVGFLRYWVPGNIPLFLLAAPMLYIMIKSGIETLLAPWPSWLSLETLPEHRDNKYTVWFIRSMAITQVFIAALSITNFHIQIISRICSAYPLWYIWLASKLSDKSTARFGSQALVFMIMYAMIQGALFASFMPPA